MKIREIAKGKMVKERMTKGKMGKKARQGMALFLAGLMVVSAVDLSGLRVNAVEMTGVSVLRKQVGRTASRASRVQSRIARIRMTASRVLRMENRTALRKPVSQVPRTEDRIARIRMSASSAPSRRAS